MTALPNCPIRDKSHGFHHFDLVDRPGDRITRYQCLGTGSMDAPTSPVPPPELESRLRVPARLRAWLLALLRVPCGAYGGRSGVPTWIEPPTAPNLPYPGPFEGRWCWKRFGHGDSCAYDHSDQPLTRERARGRGWDV